MSKRILAAASIAAFAALAAVAAQAQSSMSTWTDPQGRFSFQYPRGVDVDVLPATATRPMNILVGVADYECKMFVVSRPDDASKPADAVRRSYSTALTTAVWKQATDGFAMFDRQANVASASVDTSKLFPVHSAAMTTARNEPVVAALNVRPGIEVWQYCASFDNTNRTALFNQIVGSFASPMDAEHQAQIAAADQQRAQTTAQNAAIEAQNAQTAAQNAEAAAQNQKKQKRPSRGRGLKD